MECMTIRMKQWRRREIRRVRFSQCRPNQPCRGFCIRCNLAATCLNSMSSWAANTILPPRPWLKPPIAFLTDGEAHCCSLNLHKWKAARDGDLCRFDPQQVLGGSFLILVLTGLPSLFFAMVFVASARQCHRHSWAFYLEAPHYLAVEAQQDHEQLLGA